MGAVEPLPFRHGETSKANVAVDIHGERSVAYRKIGTIIGGVRVGRETTSEQGIIQLVKTYDVAVPRGRVPHVELDLQIGVPLPLLLSKKKTKREKSNELDKQSVGLESGHQVRVNININWEQETFPRKKYWEQDTTEGTGQQEFISPSWPSQHVEVKIMSGYLTVVYTIGDAMSFTEFIMVLRRILADHPDRQDILDNHPHFLNLSCTREHPVLARTHAAEPVTWLHIKLQVKDKKTCSSTTLLMRTDTMYVCGFKNQDGHRYQLVDNLEQSKSLLPGEGNNSATTDLPWQVTYTSLLGGKAKVVETLTEAQLGRDFAVKAVSRLSSFVMPDEQAGNSTMDARVALGGLILMVCESARMNPLHDAFARDWNNKKGLTEMHHLMKDYVWKYGKKTHALRKWKEKEYHINLKSATHPIPQLQAIYLVNSGFCKGRDHDSCEEGGRGGGGKGQEENEEDGDSGEEERGGGGGGKGQEEKGSGNGTNNSPTNKSPQDVSSIAGGGADTTATNTEGGGNVEDTKKHNEVHDGTQGNGRPLVELLSLRADLGVIGKTITVFDGKRGQIIYREEGEAVEKGGMVHLVLTGPYTRISAAFGCFAIRIDMPTPDTAPIKWEWDCYDQKYADQVDRPPMTHPIQNPANGQKVAEVTYAVMSNAREATVQVRLRPKDGPSRSGTISGEITALIQGFNKGKEKNEDKHQSVLFRRAKGKGQTFPTADDDDLLRLARNVVAVPCGSPLDIVVNLLIETDCGKQVPLNVPLSFENGIRSSKSKTNADGNEVEVEVTWYPEITGLDKTRAEIDQRDSELPAEVKMMSEHRLVVHTIKDVASYTGFIMDLRRILAEHPEREDILDSPFLARQHAEQPARWLHVKLQLATVQETTTSTTLVMRDDNLYVCGFINQDGILYKLVDNRDSTVSFLHDGCHTSKTTELHLGFRYNSLLQDKSRDSVMRKLKEKLVSGFAMDAVRVLSSHPNERQPNMSVGVALAGLIVIFCESARMKSIHNSLVVGWNKGKGFTKQLMDVWKYEEMSRKLRAWKSRNYAEPRCFSEQEATYLVLNTRLPTQAEKQTIKEDNDQSSEEDSDDQNTQRYHYYYQPVEPKVAQCHGRPRVELLAIHADLCVVGTKIIIFDGKRGQIIYRKGRQGGQEMVDLVLTGPYRGISANGCFAIKVDIPAAAPIKWEWDCYDPKFVAEVDNPQPVSHIISSSGPGRNIQITYAVMSDAAEASVQVMLGLQDGHMPGDVHGKITARICGFEVGSILFSRKRGASRQCFSATDNARFLLELARNVVAVPCGRMLHIEVDLQIETSNYQGTKHFKADLYTANGFPNQTHVVHGGEVEVKVSWYPEEKLMHSVDWETYIENIYVYTIGGDDEMSYTGLITALRHILADHPHREDILDGHKDKDLSSTRQHPLLDKPSDRRKPERLLHIKLQVAGEETSSIILAVGFDDLLVHGIKNQTEDNWHEPLDWGYWYNSILEVRTWEEVVSILDSARLGKTFAADAVRVLSRLPHVADGDSPSPRLALVGLSVMIIDAARLNPVHDAIARGWNNGMGFTEQLMDYIRNWHHISSALRDWKDSRYRKWVQDLRLERIGIKSPEDAMHVIHLCWGGRIDRFLP